MSFGISTWETKGFPFWMFFSVALVAVAAICGALAARGWDYSLLLVLAAVVFYSLGISRWRRAVYWLLLYLPFAGAVSLAMYPQKTPLIFKDLFFMIPAYLGFGAAWISGSFERREEARDRVRGIPRSVLWLLGILSIQVIAQMFNPGVVNWMMAVIGGKVWLFYLPLFVLGYAFVSTKVELYRLLRMLVVVGLVPCVLGILQAILVQVAGYERVMFLLYGSAASGATQQFALTTFGEGFFPRIPSTFTFVSQYFAFTIAMLPVCYALWRGDRSAGWRGLGGVGFLITSLAAFLSGARGAFVFVPLSAALMFALEKGTAGFVRGTAYVAAALGIALLVLKVTSASVFNTVSWLFLHYSGEIAYGGLAQALGKTFWGEGTGTNTGPARHALSQFTEFTAIENYYAKAAYELGILGLAVTAAVFLVLIIKGWNINRRITDRELRPCSAGLLAFVVVMFLYSFKGWAMDLDPINVYYWFFAGVLMKLPALAGALTREPALEPGPHPGRRLA